MFVVWEGHCKLCNGKICLCEQGIAVALLKDGMRAGKVTVGEVTLISRSLYTSSGLPSLLDRILLRLVVSSDI